MKPGCQMFIIYTRAVMTRPATESCHNADCVVIGDTGGCRHDNIRYCQWRHSLHHGNPESSMYLLFLIETRWNNIKRVYTNYTNPVANYADEYLCDLVEWSACISELIIAHVYYLASFMCFFCLQVASNSFYLVRMQQVKCRTNHQTFKLSMMDLTQKLIFVCICII